jgi:hypothetical protein
MRKLGGICAILVGILAIVSGLSFLMAPEVQKGPILDPGGLLTSFASGHTAIMIHYWALVLAPLFGIAVVLALSDLVRPVNDGWARWGTTLGIVSMGIQAANYLLAQSHTPRLAAAYIQADASAKVAIAALGPRWIDPDFWMSFGLSAIWLVILNWLALRGARIPRGLAYVGLACGISYLLIPGGFVLRLPSALSLAAGLVGLVLAPIWWIWAGVFLRRPSTAVDG